MGNPIVHFEIIGKDAARVKAFYSALFGWTIPGVTTLAMLADPDGDIFGLTTGTSS